MGKGIGNVIKKAITGDKITYTKTPVKRIKSAMKSSESTFKFPSRSSDGVGVGGQSPVKKALGKMKK